MGYEFELEERLSFVTPVYRDGGFDLDVDGRRLRAALEVRESGAYELVVEGHREPVWLAQRGDTVFLHWAGRNYQVEAINSLERASREAERSAGGDAVVAPMPGVVVDVAVEPGDRVARGERLLTIESMKLQTALDAPHDALVSEVCYAVGQSFEKGAILVRMQSAGEESGS